MYRKKFLAHTPLILLVFFAFVLRIWNLDFGLPYLYHPDEPRYLNVALHLFQTWNIDPNTIQELSINALAYSINAASYTAYYWVGHLLGFFHSPSDISPLQLITLGIGHAPYPSLVLYSRLVTVLFGTGAVFMLYQTARAFGCNQVVSLLAALLLAISPDNVIHSKFVVPDEMLVFFVCVALWVSIQLYQRERLLDYLIAGATVGFAISAKLPGAIVMLPMALAHLWRERWHSLLQPKLYLAALTALIAFSITTPFVLINPLKVYADWQLERSHYAFGHVGMEGDTVHWYANYLLSIEGPMVVVGIIGLAIGLWRQTRLTIILGSLLVVYALIFARIPVRNDRTLLPILPVLCLFAAYGLGALWSLSYERLAPRSRAVANTALIMLAFSTVGWPLFQTTRKDVELGAADGRSLAQAWVSENLPHGSKVALESYSPFLDPAIYQVQGFTRIVDQSPEWYANEGFDYIVFSEGVYGRFFRDPQLYQDEISNYQHFFQSLELIKEFEDSGYSITFIDSGYEIRIYKVKHNP